MVTGAVPICVQSRLDWCAAARDERDGDGDGDVDVESEQAGTNGTGTRVGGDEDGDGDRAGKLSVYSASYSVAPSSRLLRLRSLLLL